MDELSKTLRDVDESVEEGEEGEEIAASSGKELALLPTEQSMDEPITGDGAPLVGERLGRFEIKGVLGHGGMGYVLSAYDPQLDREVAIKLLRTREDGTASDEDKARLLREARAMARFRHPNIVAVFEAGEYDSEVYMAMERVEGGNLREELVRRRAEGRASWREVVALFAAAARGLAAAHAKKMVHRDFKPDNVLVDPEGRVLVTDFGIVGSARRRAETNEDMFSNRLTADDVVMGTPAYMAPEQHEAADIDERADQFSFCVALYEALCGQLPFEGSTRLEYLEAIRLGRIREIPAARQLPSWLHAILKRGLSYRREDRFASMEDLLVELGVASTGAKRLGARERMLLTGTVGAFAIAWAVAMTGLDVSLSYSLHYQTNIGLLALVLTLGWRGRHVLGRSDLNRQAFGFIVALSASIVVLVVGAQSLGLSPHTCGILHLLVIGTACLVVSTILGRLFILASVVYLGGFVVAARSPALFLACLLTAHFIGATTMIALFRGPRERA